MKPGTNQRRSRGRNGGGGGSNNNNSGGGGNSGGARRGGRNQNFDSNGPDVKIRGSAQQVLDKYLQLARDAQSSGDRVKAEGYLQFAEHYYRILSAEQEGDRQQRPVHQQGEHGDQGGDQQGEGDLYTEQSDRFQDTRNQGGNAQGGRAQGGNVQGGNAQGGNVQSGNVQVETRQGDTDQGETNQRDSGQRDTGRVDKAQGDKTQGDKPVRGRRRAPVKNEATLAAEAAAANEARALGNKGRNNGGNDADDDVGEAVVISTAPKPKPIIDTDDDTPEAANG